jgi:hypothetical protein
VKYAIRYSQKNKFGGLEGQKDIRPLWEYSRGLLSRWVSEWLAGPRKDILGILRYCAAYFTGDTSGKRNMLMSQVLLLLNSHLSRGGYQ